MPAEVRAEIVASVWKVCVEVGEAVQPGDVLAILESMKMEIPVHAETAGTVRTLSVGEGESVSEGQLLFVLG
ncbi:MULTISPECIES: biotin/lipoyl-binding carrier protein [unclassified Pseudonocardia]|uniref:biotin/lipoyl-binding carrier protein n=1 Tax=unclassified Pseudonocardia TaxID=2619320 RepID=UPI00095F8064|nr:MULTISPECIES: biotin/lipoyl-binding carrier protein [unclassified Pseudonocardia]MBN9097886.1 biotin/lipoyl-binding carrier protein [Pseudonocardia sp.]OJY49112.1 MAG: acetyl-CoA carboxylase biotin carboxyl carrier protein subunit [Pseudonocardia sp. 73-21]